MDLEANEVCALKEWRLRRHLSHRGLAKLSSVSTDTLIAIEKAKRLVYRELTERKIADALGIKVSQVEEFRREV